MKNLFCLLVILFAGLTSLTSCGDGRDLGDGGVQAYDFKDLIKSVEAIGVTVPLGISFNENRHEVNLHFKGQVDLSNLRLRFTLAEGVTLADANSTEANFNLADKEAIVRLQTSSCIVKYKLKATARTTEEVDPITLGWSKVTDKGELPSHIQVYKSPLAFHGQNNVNAYIAIADLNGNGSFEVLGNDVGKKTPQEFYQAQEEGKKPSILINAGFFDKDKSVSMIVRNGRLVDNNTTVKDECYITRSAIGRSYDGEFNIQWVYAIGTDIYAYPLPAMDVNSKPTNREPTDTYPAGGFKWNPTTAIGGSPILLKDGEYKNYWEVEAIGGIGPQDNNYRARTAIGITSNQNLILFVCQETSASANDGLNLKTVANILKELGCADAMNLDGGGST
ncbi:MAG: phosphodiester glycosidase family protein, partial [Bacteroidaceae bacterium]